MNPKIALFLSTTLTAFVVATLSGVVNKVTSTNSAAAMAPVQTIVQQAPTATLDQPTDLPTATVQTPVDPMLATTLASQAINRQDVYSVESTTYNGVEAYKVVFSSGDVVYIGMDSQVLAQTKLKPVVVNVAATAPPKKHNKNSDDNNQTGNSGSGEHEGEGGD